MSPSMDVPQYWSYAEPDGFDTAAARLAVLRRWIGDLSEVVVAKDPISPAEAREIAEAQRKKSEDLFKSLEKTVDEAKGKK